MEVSEALAVVVLVLGVTVLWGWALWVVNGHWARVCDRILRNQEELEKRLWLSETAEKPHQADAAGRLALQLDASAPSNSSPHFALNEESLMAP